MLASAHTHRAAIDLPLQAAISFLYLPPVPTSNDDPGSAAEIDKVRVLITTPDGLEHLAPTWLADLIVTGWREDLEDTAEEDRADVRRYRRAA